MNKKVFTCEKNKDMIRLSSNLLEESRKSLEKIDVKGKGEENEFNWKSEY